MIKEIPAINQDRYELKKLHTNIFSVCGSFSKVDQKKTETAKKIELIKDGIENDKKIVSLLKTSNRRISEELQTAQNEYGEMKDSMKTTGELVGKLEKMDSMKTELSGLRRANALMRLKVTPLSAQIWRFQEDLFNLRKEKKEALKEHSETMKLKNEVIGLRTKVLPLSQLLDLKDRLAEKSTRLEKNSKEAGRLKEELSGLIPIRENLKQEIETTVERLSSIEERMNSMKEKTEKLSSKVMPEEGVKKLDEEVATLRKKKGTLTEEKSDISPKIASIAEEEEKMSTVLESYKLKNKKDGDKLSALKKELKGMDINKASIDKLREKVSSAEGELEVKRKELGNLKNEYSQVISSNQEYKATIAEVEKGTKKLKKLMKKKKK